VGIHGTENNARFLSGIANCETALCTPVSRSGYVFGTCTEKDRKELEKKSYNAIEKKRLPPDSNGTRGIEKT
jgi:hypothetical protein